MLKKNSLTALLLALLFLCVACQQSPDESTAESPQGSTVQTESTEAGTGSSSAEETGTTASEPKLTDGFRALIEAEIERSAIIKQANKKTWFSDYNGERLQLIEGERNIRPSTATGVVFYRSVAGEKLEDILVIMVDKLMEPFFILSEERPFTVTEYFLDIENQRIWDKEDIAELIVEDVWDLWLEHRSYGYRPEQFIPLAVEMAAGDGLYAIGDEMWLLPSLKGYYKYEGKDFGLTFEEYRDSRQEKNGMMPFQGQGSGDAFIFLLVKYGDIYRLSQISAFGYEPWIHTDPFEKQ